MPNAMTILRKMPTGKGAHALPVALAVGHSTHVCAQGVVALNLWSDDGIIALCAVVALLPFALQIYVACARLLHSPT